MALTLILMRHAKSSSRDETLADHDRPLSERGRRAAPAMARWLAGAGHVPAEALVSAARRAAQTWALMAPELGRAVTVRHLAGIYHADAPALLEVVRGAAAGPVLLLGHNPAIGELAAALVRTPPPHPRWPGFATAAIAVIRFDAPGWAEITAGSGVAVAFVTPRDL